MGVSLRYFPILPITGHNENIDEIGIGFHPVDYNNIPVENMYGNFNLNTLPNPSKDILNIETKLILPYKVFIYDINGKMVFKEEKFSDGNIDLTGLKKGNYILKVITEKNYMTKKIIIN